MPMLPCIHASRSNWHSLDHSIENGDVIGSYETSAAFESRRVRSAQRSSADAEASAEARRQYPGAAGQPSGKTPWILRTAAAFARGIRNAVQPGSMLYQKQIGMEDVIAELATGQSYPLGATLKPDGANFSIFSRSATSIELLFFDRVDDCRPSRIIPIDPLVNRTYHYWHVFAPGPKIPRLRAVCISGHQVNHL